MESDIKTIAIDFDGVLHRYALGWQDGSCYDIPVRGAASAMVALSSKYDLIVFTCRDNIVEAHEWIKKNIGLAIPVTMSKPIADMYIDDRGYHFDGDWEKAVAEVERRAANEFRSHGR